VLVAIVGSSSPIRDIALGNLRRVFLGEPVQSPTGQKLLGFNHPPKTRARMLFDELVLGMDPDEVARHWVDQRIRVGARPPRVVPNVPLLRQVISRLPGAIGYLTIADLDPSVRALTIDGAAPDSARYALK
ncbi:MAG TPA: hypothetical protein VMG12_08020, partial [Polyangiaceae bacterium]|nr:hypothetical protein [Polyangiaceae bacterium]